MWRGERLVQVDVHHVKPHVTRTACTKHRVQVGTVVIHQSSAVVNHLGNRGDVTLEKSEGIGVGHHHGSDVGTFLGDQILKVFQVYQTVLC